MNLFFKKNTKKEDEVTPEKQAEEQTTNEDIEIYSMPEKYRTEHVKVGKAKITGIIILVFGVVVLLIMSVAMYYILFAGSDEEKQSTVSQSLNVEKEQKTAVGNSENDTKQESLDKNSRDKKEASTEILPNQLNSKEKVATSSKEDIDNQESLMHSAIGGIDSDSDGLTDSEEQLLGTDLSKADSDNDGYDDLVELKNFYNPAGAGRLIENLNIREIKNTNYNYVVYYPAEWVKKNSDNYESVLFTASDNHFVQIIAQQNYSDQTINDWYREQFDLTEIETSLFVIGSNWTGLTSLDGLTVYLSEENKKNIFALTYNIGSSDILEYKNIFDVMVKSFKFID